MNISNPQYVTQQGYPLLSIEIDGQKALISPEQKPTLLAQGIVYIASSFEETHSVEFGGEQLRGCSNDKQLVTTVKKFIKEVRG